MFFNQRINTNIIIIKVLIKKGKQELRPTLKCWFANFLHTWPIYSFKRQLWLIIKVYYIQGVLKRIRQNYYLIFQKQRTIKNSSLGRCVVQTCKFYFMFYKCSVWPQPAARTTSSRYENSSQTRLSMSRFTVLIADVIQFFMLSIFSGSNAV